MRSRLFPLGGLLGGVLLAMIAAATVAGYAGQVVATIEVSGPLGQLSCDTPISITARVEDINGDPIEGQSVTWSFDSGNVSGDTILDTTTTTNASGIATTQVQLTCSPHSVTLLAAADDATGSIVLTITGAGGVLGTTGLPRTDTSMGTSLPAMALGVLAVLIGSGTVLGRVIANRRR
jgi:hypothetical protein